MTDVDQSPSDPLRPRGDQLPGNDQHTDASVLAGGTAARTHSPLRMRLIVASLAAAGIAVLVVAALVGSGGPGSANRAVTAGPAVDQVIPEPDAEVLQQQRVGVVLNPRYRLTTLVVYPNDRFTGGVNVSEEVGEIEGLNLFEFVPGDGRLIESLSPDANCVRATFVLIARPDESDTVQWCFEVS